MSSDPIATNATHARILDAAWEHLVARGHIGSMREIAAACGISRQAVYLYAGSRTGLVVQAVGHFDQTSGITDGFAESVNRPDAIDALDATLAAWFDYVPRVLPAARVLIAASITDTAAATAWDDRMEAIRAVFRYVVERLEAAEVLRPCWTIDQAADALWSLTHVRAYDDLVNGRGWDVERFTGVHVDLAHALLLDNVDEHRAPHP